MDDKLQSSLSSLKQDLTDLLGKVTHEKFEYPEHDLRWFVWKDSPSDIPQKLAKSGTTDNKRSLQMKTRGFSPNIAKLCEDFDRNLLELLSDLKQYLYEVEHPTPKDDPLAIDISLLSNKFCDRSDIQEHLQKVTAALVVGFVAFVKERFAEQKSERQNVITIVISRFLQALTILCPNLRECFTLSRTSGIASTNAKWQAVRDVLVEGSVFIWSVWANNYRANIRQHRDKFLTKETSDALRMHSTIIDWERVSIEEEAEEGKRIKSEILVPYQPSVCLQQCLASICKDLNKVIPHTIPK